MRITYIVFVLLIILAGCGTPEESTKIIKSEISTKITNTKVINSQKYNIMVYIIDSCEYLGECRYEDVYMGPSNLIKLPNLIHKGNCRFCIKRKCN